MARPAKCLETVLKQLLMVQSEGEVLARRNGELESALRKLRVAAKESEGERERLQSRLKQQDELLCQERQRFETALTGANQQV